ncbi:hypothetical protein F2P81_014372 [Scophthalmus maximus]|uniref:Uncharacterized protein n=1 Tax=Scophthalmus maximus TaxID=52904 RepID=A0A6A4SGM8_SCOMX|nr:hypothetical protein F2P81_014372 [Scophthalmus maximus]
MTPRTYKLPRANERRLLHLHATAGVTTPGAERTEPKIPKQLQRLIDHNSFSGSTPGRIRRSLPLIPVQYVISLDDLFLMVVTVNEEMLVVYCALNPRRASR